MQVLKDEYNRPIRVSYDEFERIKADNKLSQLYYGEFHNNPILLSDDKPIIDIEEKDNTNECEFLEDLIKPYIKDKVFNSYVNYSNKRITYSTTISNTYFVCEYSRSPKTEENSIVEIRIFSNYDNKEAIEFVESLQEQLFQNFGKELEDTAKINLIIERNNELALISSKLHNTPELNFNYYNDDFGEFYDKLKNNITTKGLSLLYGEPGTGKTSFIKTLTKIVPDKEFIFVPPNMTSVLSSPNFMQFMIKHSNSILIIEDAEDCLINQGSTRDSKVSNLLNLTDGMLADVTNIHIICTFNVDLKNIDEALLRPGRLKTKYEFKKLSSDRVQKITDGKLNEECTIAEITNNKIELEKQTKIGF